MYRLSDYRAMILDDVRTSAYERALAQAIRPGSTVIELGTGFGYFAVAACRAGARHVYAVDPHPVVQLGAELARANGCADRIEFIQNVSTSVSIPPADVLVSDLRGVLPLLRHHIPAIVDARRRLLAPGGVQIPERDTIWLALVSSSAGSADRLERTPSGIELGPVEQAIGNLWQSVRLEPSDLISEPALWRTVDYRTIESPDLEGEVELRVERPGTIRGIGAWFETQLHGAIGFTTAPGGPSTVYGHALFPLPALSVAAGNRIRVRLRAHLVGEEYVWSWEGGVVGEASPDLSFSRSTFYAAPLSPRRLRRRSDRFEPRLGREGQAQAWILARMAASERLGGIAQAAVEAFPDVFGDFSQALRRVADLSEQLSE